MKKPASRGTGQRRSRPAIKSSHEKVLEGRARSSHEKTLDGRARSSHEKVLDGRVKKPLPKPSRTRLPPGKPRPPAPPPRESSTSWSVASDSARERATAIAIAALDKKAVGLEILDVAGKVDYADFLVIMTGRSDRHAQALAQGIEEALKRKGVRPMAVEGLPHGSWVLMDFGDVVVHVFLEEARQLYDIDGLWLDARRLPVPGWEPSATEPDA